MPSRVLLDDSFDPVWEEDLFAVFGQLAEKSAVGGLVFVLGLGIGSGTGKRCDGRRVRRKDYMYRLERKAMGSIRCMSTKAFFLSCRSTRFESTAVRCSRFGPRVSSDETPGVSQQPGHQLGERFSQAEHQDRTDHDRPRLERVQDAVRTPGHHACSASSGVQMSQPDGSEHPCGHTSTMYGPSM